MARRSTVRRVEELILFEDSRSVHRPALQRADRRSRKRPRRDPPPPLPDGLGRDGSHRIHRLSRPGSYPAGCRVTRHANRARHSGGPRVRIRLPPAASPQRTLKESQRQGVGGHYTRPARNPAWSTEGEELGPWWERPSFLLRPAGAASDPDDSVRRSDHIAGDCCLCLRVARSWECRGPCHIHYCYHTPDPRLAYWLHSAS